jgi:hypothetical protein
MNVYHFNVGNDGWIIPKCPHRSSVEVGKSHPSVGSYACVAMCAYCIGFRNDSAFKDIPIDYTLPNMSVRCYADECLLNPSPDAREGV